MTREERAATIKTIRETFLIELAGRVAAEPPGVLEHDVLAAKLWKDEIDRIGNRLARGWGLDYPEQVIDHAR